MLEKSSLEYDKASISEKEKAVIEKEALLDKRDRSCEKKVLLFCCCCDFSKALTQATNGSNARGYFVWSFLDVFELLDGFVSSFGLYCVDLNDPDLRRYPKLSQLWYSSFLKGESISLSDVHAGNDPGALPQ